MSDETTPPAAETPAAPHKRSKRYAESGRPPAAAAAEDAGTKRTVVKQERVIVIPEGVETVDEKKLLEAFGVKSKGALVTTEAWIVIGEFEGSTKDNAIEAYTGPAGHPDTKLGVFKAPPARGWAGGLRMKAPPKPLSQKEAIE